MLSASVESYVALHLAVGYRFRDESSILRLFARHAEASGDEVVRTQTLLAWSAEARTPGARRRRLHVVRRFARRLAAEDPRHEVPAPDAFGPKSPRRAPYILPEEELRNLLDAAGRLGPNGSLRPRMYVALLGLLACTGLRISEALALQLTDLTDDGLVIRRTKFKKSRLVPLHETARQALTTYLNHRSRKASLETAMFLSESGTRLRYVTVNAIFLRLARAIGIHPGPGKPGPRLHDLRHTFAVRSLEQCAGDRQDVARHMLALSTYLGHSRLADTYWYLQATPRLLSDVAVRIGTLVSGVEP